jgi:hypothetical protein
MTSSIFDGVFFDEAKKKARLVHVGIVGNEEGSVYLDSWSYPLQWSRQETEKLIYFLQHVYNLAEQGKVEELAKIIIKQPNNFEYSELKCEITLNEEYEYEAEHDNCNLKKYYICCTSRFKLDWVEKLGEAYIE